MKNASLLCIALAVAITPAFAAEVAPFTSTVTGHGRPMILIPGLACPGDVWADAASHFDDNYECHVISLAGFGGKPAALEAGAPLLATARVALADYIRSRQLDRPVIVGHSLGGFLALDLAARHPDLAGELVIVDSLPFLAGIMRPDATADDAKQIAAATVQAFSGMDSNTYAAMIRGGANGSTMATAEADLQRIIAWGQASDSATVAKAMTELYSADLRSDLARIRSRTLVLAAWAGYAPYSSHDIAERLYRSQYAAHAAFTLAIHDTARHFIMLDDPAWTFSQIENFLAVPES